MAHEREEWSLLHDALAVHLGFTPGPEADSVVEIRPELDASARAVIATVARELLERHGGDPARCLQSLSSFERVLEQLERDQRTGSHPTVGAPLDSIDEGEVPAYPPQTKPAAAEVGLPTSTGMRFRLLRAHAQGGIGRVFVAYDAELQREVALKQIKAERADDPDSRARFLLEAEVTGRLEHPGVVPVYGLGVDERGRPFYAMRFVRGQSLEQAIKHYHDSPASTREKSLELRKLLTRFVDICQTIAYAHSRGVLHRDIKPANVLLGPFNEALVVDWGLAKIFGKPVQARAKLGPGASAKPASAEPAREPDQPRPKKRSRRVELVVLAPAADTSTWPAAESASDTVERPVGLEEPAGEPGFTSSTETAAGTAFGTPAFMSPEQAEGRHDELGPTTDVYSLGAVLYTLLCGRAPFEYIWCDVTALLERVKVGEFPTPRKIKATVPRALEAICLKAMARRPEERYATAALLAEDVER